MRFQYASLWAALAAVFASMPVGAAQAAQWQKVAAGKGESVAIDVGRLALADNGRVQAWSRLTLAKALPAGEGDDRYDAVEVLNSYDCANGRYAPIKRVFLHGETVLKVEPTYGAQDQAATPGLDTTLLKEVCRRRPALAADTRNAPSGAVPASDSKFSVMHAELVTEGKDGKGKTVAVADKPGEKAADRPADGGRVEAPRRMIELPKIDKSQLEKPTDTKPGDKPGEKPAEKVAEKAPEKASDKPAEKKPVEKAPEKAVLADKPVRGASSSIESLNGVDKHTRELALATTGPRRVIRKKPQEVAPAVVEHAHIHWGYEGEGGPANWARIDGQNALCGTGKRQSPIDIGESIKVDLESIRFDYKPTLFRIEDNGHTIQVTPAEGNTIKVMGRTYELKQFHFHRPSEEKVNGKRFDMVVHLVHKDDDGNIAVVAVLLEKGEQEQGVIQTLWNNMPLEAGQSLTPSTPIDLLRLLPTERSYYTYMGSLTTPPCTEGVLWMVFKQPVTVTPEQVSVFSRLYKNNARPIQPAWGRLVKESR